MLVPRAFWRPVGRLVGKAAPRPMAAYYRAVIRSYVNRLSRTPSVEAVYAYGSFFGKSFRPGRSDVDLVVVTSANSVDDELDSLHRLRRTFRRYQGLLPIDLWPIPSAEFETTAAWVTAMRPRSGDEHPAREVKEWHLLDGDERRTDRMFEPDPRLSFFGDYFILGPLAAVALRSRPGGLVASQLAELVRDARRERLSKQLVQRLDVAHRGLSATSGRSEIAVVLEAALTLIDEHRRQNLLPYEGRLSPDSEWRVPVPNQEADADAGELLATLDGTARTRLRSATVYTPPFEAAPVLLLEGEHAADCGPLLRWAVERAASSRRKRLGLHVLTSVLAQDLWRDGLTPYALAAGRHLDGEPLAPRLGLPSNKLHAQLLRYLGFWEVATTRLAFLGHRAYVPDERRPLRLAALRTLATEDRPVTDPTFLAEALPELEPEDVRRPEPEAAMKTVLLIWRCWPRVSRGDRQALEDRGRDGA